MARPLPFLSGASHSLALASCVLRVRQQARGQLLEGAVEAVARLGAHLEELHAVLLGELLQARPSEETVRKLRTCVKRAVCAWCGWGVCVCACACGSATHLCVSDRHLSLAGEIKLVAQQYPHGPIIAALRSFSRLL